MITAHMPEAPSTTSMNIMVLRFTTVSLIPPGETDHIVIGDEALNTEIVGALE